MSGDRVRVYLVPVPSHAEGAVLTPDEDEQLGQYVSERGRLNFITRRSALRVLLGRELGVEPRAVRLERDRFGKPRVAGGGGGIRFNVSDTDGLVAIAVARDHEVGVDVEWLKPRRFDGLAKTTFTRDELIAFRSAPPARRPGVFYEQWTSKEAYSKAVGLGLRLPFTRTQVGTLADEPAALPCSATFAGARIDVGSGHRAAVVASGSDWRPEVERIGSLADLTG